MEIYDSEEQQVEAIKSWWKENGKSIIVGLVVGIGGIFGWHAYQDHQVQQNEDASHAYQKVVDDLSSKKLKAADEASQFIKEYSSSNYSVLAAMQLAKVQVDADKLDDALTQLQTGLKQTKDETLQSILNFRIARVLAAQKEYDKALTQLTKIDSKAWQAQSLELQGDILLQKKDLDGAREAYTKAQQAPQASPALQVKLDDLAQ